jgi:hypothetical protein
MDRILSDRESWCQNSIIKQAECRMKREILVPSSKKTPIAKQGAIKLKRQSLLPSAKIKSVAKEPLTKLERESFEFSVAPTFRNAASLNFKRLLIWMEIPGNLNLLLKNKRGVSQQMSSFLGVDSDTAERQYRQYMDKYLLAKVRLQYFYEIRKRRIITTH